MNLPLAFSYSDEFFNVVDTLTCGQLFRYKDLGSGRYGLWSQDKYAEAEQHDGKVFVYALDGDYFWRYFDLDEDYASKVKRIAEAAPIMQLASQGGKGIRILKQDPAETVINFIISANNNIKRIQLIIERICAALGEQTEFGYAFPSVFSLSQADASFYRSVGAGYRDVYLADTAKRLTLEGDLHKFDDMQTESLRRQLLTYLGVGPKVADCILLFGFGRGEAFPVDTWLKKVYHKYFEAGHKDGQVADYFCNLFGSDAGLAQQHLFYFERSGGLAERDK